MSNKEAVQKVEVQSGGKKIWKALTGEYSVILITIAAILVAWIIDGAVLQQNSFMDAQNFINIFRNNAVIGVLAFGMAFVIISGNIDLSIGSQLVAVAAICLGVLNATGSIVLALLAAFGSGIGMSAGAGFIVTKGRVPSFIVTLGLMNIYRAVCMYFMSGGGFYGEVDSFTNISNYLIGDVFPLPILYLAIVFLIYFYISKYTKLGRQIYAVGSNEKATKLSGINTDRVKIMAFVLMGLAVAISAIMEASRMNSINASSSGLNYELNAIAMAVVGGIAMEGGKGTMIGALFGVLIIGILNNILTLIGMDVFLVNAVKGAVIIIAVLFQKKEVEV